MAVFEGTIFSKALNKDTYLTVILPHDSRPHVGINGKLVNGIKPHAHPHTMILLHGYTDCDSTWVRRTSLERYAELYDMAIVMPDGESSFYNNMVYGPKFFDYITEELPELASQLFQVAVDPENLYIGGLSMGGYGALLCALTYPERYAGCVAFSAGADVKGVNKLNTDPSLAKDMDTSMKAIFGDPIVVPDTSDLYWLAERVPSKLDLYMTCGRQDFTYESNVRLRDVLKTNKNVKLEWEEWDGIHEWGFWDVSIAKFFEKYIKD
ncbi:MAG: esterase family protein [Oscillospiraceae bacterium]|nr:esterase family protein [Oscillospiraceae bacterium]